MFPFVGVTSTRNRVSWGHCASSFGLINPEGHTHQGCLPFDWGGKYHVWKSLDWYGPLHQSEVSITRFPVESAMTILRKSFAFSRGLLSQITDLFARLNLESCKFPAASYQTMDLPSHQTVEPMAFGGKDPSQGGYRTAGPGTSKPSDERSASGT